MANHADTRTTQQAAADMAVDLGLEERLLLQVLQKYIRQHLTETAFVTSGNSPVTGQLLRSSVRV